MGRFCEVLSLRLLVQVPAVANRIIAGLAVSGGLIGWHRGHQGALKPVLERFDSERRQRRPRGVIDP
jgi:hypothetical protein